MDHQHQCFPPRCSVGSCLCRGRAICAVGAWAGYDQRCQWGMLILLVISGVEFVSCAFCYINGRGWKIFLCRKILPRMVKIYANQSSYFRCSRLVNRRTRKLSLLSKRPHLWRTKIESGGGTSHVLPTARYCLMNDSRNQKIRKEKKKNTTPKHGFGAYRIHGWDVQKQPFNSNMGFGPTTLRFPFAHALYKELTHFCYWNVLGRG